MSDMQDQAPMADATTTSDATSTVASSSAASSGASGLVAASGIYYDVAKINAAVHILLFFPVLILWIMQLKRRARNWSAWFLLQMYINFQVIGSILVVHKGKEAISLPGVIFMIVGFTPLLMAAKSAINQCARETSLGESFFFKKIASALYVFLGVVSVLLMTFGLIGTFKANASEKAKTRAPHFIKGSTAIFCLMYLINIVTGFIVIGRWSVLISTRKLILACILSVPIFAVRIVSLVIAVYKPANTFFSITSGSLAMHIGFWIVPCTVIVVVFVLAGFAQLNDLNRFESEKAVIPEYN